MATDYKIEADDNLTLALEHTAGYGHLSTAHLIALAQVNATLAVAEQQRIANLIALAGQQRIDTGIYETVDHDWDTTTLLASDIREGLGL